MNEDMEKKLDQLLAEMPKREYDLDAWLAEEQTPPALALGGRSSLYIINNRCRRTLPV